MDYNKLFDFMIKTLTFLWADRKIDFNCLKFYSKLQTYYKNSVNV